MTRRRRPPGAARWRVLKSGLLAVGLVLSVLVSSVVVAPASHADPLAEQHKRVTRALATVAEDLDEHNAALDSAHKALQSSREDLARAQETLRTAIDARQAAQKDDAKLADEVRAAEAELTARQAEVAQGLVDLEEQRHRTGDVVRNTVQKSTRLLGVAALVTNLSTGDVTQQMQWSTTLFQTTQAHMDVLQEAQLRLEAAEAAQQEAADRLTEAKKLAQAHLARTKTMERKAQEAQHNLTRLVRDNQRAEKAFAAQVRADQRRQAALKKERASVENKIAKRIAAAKKRHLSFAGDTGGGYSASAWFSFPVSGPITSSYGMRFHPVLHVWKLHDGTDFGASCGTAIRAPRAGVVSEKYYNVGYGNRLMIDHGRVGGHYVTTGYNHAERYVVHVGQHVKRGQVIGYVGTTGFSTGCHLHFMVWQDGRVVNAMTKWL